MTKNSKIFKFIEYVISVLALFVFWLLGGRFADVLFDWNPEISGKTFTLCYIGLIILMGIFFVISIVVHELGHLVFGIKAGLKFVEFNILSISFKIKDNKLKAKIMPKIAGIGGYCNLRINEYAQYSQNSVILYFLGGILFNLILTLLTLIVIFTTNSIWVKYFAELLCAINIYFILNNSIPSITPTGMEVDMLKILHTYHDHNYINTLGKLQRITQELNNGKNICEMNVSCPQKFQTLGDVFMGILYLDYLIAVKNYKDVENVVNKIREEAGECLSAQNNHILSAQLFRCELETDCNVEKLAQIWTKSFNKYVNVMATINPIFLGCQYAHAVLIEKKENKAWRILNEISKLTTDKFEKLDIDECLKLVEIVDSKKTS